MNFKAKKTTLNMSGVARVKCECTQATWRRTWTVTTWAVITETRYPAVLSALFATSASGHTIMRTGAHNICVQQNTKTNPSFRGKNQIFEEIEPLQSSKTRIGVLEYLRTWMYLKNREFNLYLCVPKHYSRTLNGKLWSHADVFQVGRWEWVFLGNCENSN